MKLRTFIDDAGRQELDIPKDTMTVVLNSETEISICYETKRGFVDKDDSFVVVVADSKDEVRMVGYSGGAG